MRRRTSSSGLRAASSFLLLQLAGMIEPGLPHGTGSGGTIFASIDAGHACRGRSRRGGRNRRQEARQQLHAQTRRPTTHARKRASGERAASGRLRPRASR